MQVESKHCEQCGTTILKSTRWSKAQWERKRFCSTPCANTWRARRQKRGPARTRRDGERWARWWEQQRRREDRADLARVERQQRRVKRATTILATARQFIGHTCRACGATWVQYAARDDSDLCSVCTKSKWRMNHRQRAKHYGVAHEHIDHFEVFAADAYRCQLCGLKTKGTHPDPRSPTLDHIVPLSCGGPHLRHNVQTAHLRCNVQKHNGAANDQLRLELAA